MGTQTVSEFFKRNQAKIQAAVDAHKNDEIKGGGGFGLPAGINGVAKLISIGFKTDEEDGSTAFVALAELDTPEYAKDGQYVKGMKSRKEITIRDAEFDKDMAMVMGIMRRLAGHDLFAKGGSFDFNAMCETIQIATRQKPIYFRLSTSMGRASGQIDPKTGEPYPPRVQEWWNDAIPGYTPGARTSAPPPSSNGSHANGAAKGEGGPAWSEKNPPAGEYRDDADLGSLLARAKKDDRQAYDDLRGQCMKKGWTEEEFDAAGYDEIEEYLSGKDEEKEPEKKEPPIPVAGETRVKFAPPDPKKEGKRLKAVDCAVTAVQSRNETMTLKNLETKKEYKGVAWDDENVEYDDE